jgi:hypothetical protein
MLALFALESAPSQNSPLLSSRLTSSLIYLISLSSHLLPLLLFSFSYTVVLQLDVLVAGAFPTRMPACEEFDYQECHLDATPICQLFEIRRSASELAHEISTVSLVLH